jgi:NAD(P)H-dependent flavin oxidoreductase YrpB (nitropropane dioxygenase family)
MAAAMALGASGVWTGTVWTVTEEAETHPVVMQKLLQATSSDTVRSKAWSGKPCRLLRSSWTDEWDGPAAPEFLKLPMHTMLIEEAWRSIDRAALANNPGARSLINQPIGQVVGRLNHVRPAAKVFMEMVEEFVDVTEQLSRTFE